METLTNIATKVKQSCGMHTHCGAADLSLQHCKNLFKHYVKFKDVLDAMMPQSRRSSHDNDCKSLLYRFECGNRTQTINCAFAAIDHASSLEDLYSNVTGRDRYFKLNLLPFWQHDTLEFRQHAGTVDADKACQWVLFLGTWMERALATNPKKVTEREFTVRRAWKTEFDTTLARLCSTSSISPA
ncbi:amidoligase family protein [Phormidium sp. FACHB-592]|uniref:Amidoligase family protein n=1 Tax=Stenomitos frigidus AS-A4 TaxID=2933935 RepID=A0ABV0KQC3_9CYAN|nr:amidoligase family protein [Phormidium sp. FACHB-592]MBD2074974.1 amidoligase family protein [Phormidium sp. FACHB-592]